MKHLLPRTLGRRPSTGSDEPRNVGMSTKTRPRSSFPESKREQGLPGLSRGRGRRESGFPRWFWRQVEDRLELLLEARLLGRHDRLHPEVQVARHPVGRAEEELRLAGVGEVEDPRVLEESADDADHADRLAPTRQTRAPAAVAAHDHD